MKRSIYLCRLLAVLLTVGLVLAPLSAPANAAAMASTEIASMSGDMPCCPDKSAPVDCDQCPLMAICVVKTLQAPPSGGMAEILPVTLRTLRPHSDPKAESLGYLPPPKPPRYLVGSA